MILDGIIAYSVLTVRYTVDVTNYILVFLFINGQYEMVVSA